MTLEDSSNPLPTGLRFFWYENKPGEEHAQHWAQLCASIHRLVFIREELEVVNNIRDMNQALERLAYHMENYLVRIYELRERVAKLLATFSGYRGNIGQLKWRETRQEALSRLLHIGPKITDQYLRLLSILDDDIDLRNQNTHDTFLGLGFSTGYDIFDPHDVLVDLQDQVQAHKDFKKRLRKEIGQAVRRYDMKIDEIIHLTRGLLEEMGFTEKRTPTTRS
jgi:hypothetical protein